VTWDINFTDVFGSWVGRVVNVRSFSELSNELDEQPEADRLRAGADAELTAELVAYSLGELREQVEVTQSVLAERLCIKQPSVSALERQDDMLLSTLRNTIEALGGELRIDVRFPAVEGGRSFRLRLDDIPAGDAPVSGSGGSAISTTRKASKSGRVAKATKKLPASGTGKRAGARTRAAG
jgi:hypothetical protein